MKAWAGLALGLLICGCGQREEGLMSEWDAAATGVDVPPAAADAPPANAAGGAPAPQPEPKKTLNKREARLVDKNKALAENPDLVEVENSVNATDPLTAISQSYFTIGSRAQVGAMQHNLRIQKEIDGHWPSFEEFEKAMNQNGFVLTALYPWQMYAYDDQTGGIVVLEDRAEMKRQYEAAGREYPHAE